MSETLQLTCPEDVDHLHERLMGLVKAGKRPNVTIEIVRKRRTSLQNRSLHKFFMLLADGLNAAGLDMRVYMQQAPEIPWTPEAVKLNLWKPIQVAMTGKESTADLTTIEIQDIERVVSYHLGEKHGFHAPEWPCEDSQRREYQELQAAQNA